MPVIREPNGNVVVRSNFNNSEFGFAMRCHHLWGGACLDAWNEPHPGPVTNAFPGSAINPTCETGQDPTQATADGMTPNPIARMGNSASIVRYNYYMRELALSNNQYKVGGFFPIFWLSHEPHDDVIVPVQGGGDSGWRTRYNPGPTNQFAQMFQIAPTTIYYQATSNNAYGGYLAPGNEMAPFPYPSNLWVNRLCQFPDGRIAARITVSMAKTTDGGASAGFAFRKLIPQLCSDVNYVHQTQGYLFRVTKSGVWELAGGSTPDYRIAYGKLTSAEKTNFSKGGIELEMRTHNGIPGHVELYVSGRLVFVSNSLIIAGPHFLLYGKCSSGFIIYDQRRLHDVSINSEVTYQPRENGTIRYSVLYNLVPEARGRPFYRANMNFFMSPTIFPIESREAKIRLNDDSIIDYEGVMPLNDIKSMWLGSGANGMSVWPVEMKVDGVSTFLQGAHGQLQKRGANNELVMAVNPLALSNNTVPLTCRSLSLVVDLRTVV